MEFRILGALEVEEDGRLVALGGDKQRSLLALLLLGRGRPVSTERLIEEIWHGEPPATAAKSIQVYAARLRSALGSERIVKRRRGYELLVAPGEVDADRFEQLVVAASGAPPAEAASYLKEALALWRGHPLADLSLEPWAETETARLEERWLAAFEDWVDAELALGNHRELVLKLEALVAEHPFREQLLERLVLALYRSGRQAEALSAYRRGAARLRSELGLEPSQSLRELETRILRQDESLAAPRRAEAAAARRRRSWRLLVAGAGVVVAAAVAAAVVESTRGSRASLVSVPPGVAIVDVARQRLVAHLPMRDAAEATTGDGSFWVWRLNPFSMLQVDSRSGREGKSVESPRGDIGGFLIDGKTLWFSGSQLERMDIASGRELWSKRLSRIRYDDVQGIARGAGSLWVARAVEGDVLRLDPATGAVRARIRVPHGPDGLVYAPDGLWVTTSDAVKRIDPATDEITASAAVPGNSSSIAFGGSYVWVSNEVEGTVSKIDESGRLVASYDTGPGAHQVSYADGTLWVANQDDGTVTGIDAVTGEERTFRFGHPLQSVAALPGRLLVELNAGRTFEDRIDALRGKVARLIVPIYQLGDPDPAVGPAPNPFIFQVEHATCAPLLGYPDAAAPAGQRLVPEVAKAWPSRSRDRRTYTFVVRKGFRFAPPSGASLDAQTFRFSIERALSPRLGPRALGIRYLADVEGATQFHAGRAAHVAGISLRGNRISFTLVRPSPDFLERLALPYFCPVPRGTPILDGGVQGTPPPGAGPYTVKDAFNGEYLILVRNPYYGGRRPQRLDAIGFREGIAADKAIRRVVAGHWDVLEDTDPLVRPGGIAARRFASAANTTGVSYRAFAGSSTVYLALDARRPPFSNAAFRQKLAWAIDRRTLAASVGAEPTTHLLPPGVRGGGFPAVTGSPSRKPFARVSVRLGFQAGDEGGSAVAEAVRAELAPLGIDVRPVAVRDLEAALRDPNTPIRVAALQTETRFPDPGSFLMQMLGRDVPAAWLPPSTRTSVARLRALTGKARDDAAQALASRLATRDVPVIAYGAPTVGTVVGPRLGCRIWNGVDQGFDLTALCLRST
jgi:DNA-binding SARP family transcriptional activator/ABC-type transport system substrate-binding protein